MDVDIGSHVHFETSPGPSLSTIALHPIAAVGPVHHNPHF